MHAVPDGAFEVSKIWAVIDEWFGDAGRGIRTTMQLRVGVESRPKPKSASAVAPASYPRREDVSLARATTSADRADIISAVIAEELADLLYELF
jgi:hypothetical protein